MELFSLAILQNDPRVTRVLSGQLCHHFQTIHAARSVPELREIIIRFRPDVVVVDMETATLGDVQRLHREFINLCIVCTHRIADEEMWTAALDAGAVDICSATDSHGILTAALRNTTLVQSVAA